MLILIIPQLTRYATSTMQTRFKNLLVARLKSKSPAMNSSIDNFQTTTKLGLLESQQPSSLISSQSSNLKRNKILIIVFFLLIILLALITGAVIINLIQKYQRKLILAEPTETLRVFCSKARFPDSCLNSIILRPDTSPDDIFQASLRAALKQVINLTSLARALILQSTAATESRKESDHFKCSSLIADSRKQLNKSMTASGELGLFDLRVDSDDEMEMLVKEKSGEVSQWVNDAADDLRRCFGILGKGNSTAVIELRSGVHKGIMQMSNICDFLGSRDGIRGEIHYRKVMNLYFWDDVATRDGIIIFAPQYFMLIFLFCLLLRVY